MASSSNLDSRLLESADSSTSSINYWDSQSLFFLLHFQILSLSWAGKQFSRNFHPNPWNLWHFIITICYYSSAYRDLPFWQLFFLPCTAGCMRGKASSKALRCGRASLSLVFILCRPLERGIQGPTCALRSSNSFLSCRETSGKSPTEIMDFWIRHA